jgi:DNA-binding PadR family transcriptional regulator
MYELIILSFVMRRPTHGYLILKIINDIIGPYAKFSSGRLYPLLAKLQADGLITTVGDAPEAPGDRQPRVYEITETGRRRFHELMMDTSSNPGDYARIFWHKLPSLSTLAPVERLYLLDHYITFCQTHIFHVTSELEDLERDATEQQWMTAEQLDATLRAMGHARNQWQLELENAQDWRAREVAKLESADHPAGALQASEKRAKKA